MSQNTIALLQSVLVFLQLVNAGLAGLAHVNPIVTIILSAAVGFLQTYLQRLGNQSISPQVSAMLSQEQLSQLPGSPQKVTVPKVV